MPLSSNKFKLICQVFVLPTPDPTYSAQQDVDRPYWFEADCDTMAQSTIQNPWIKNLEFSPEKGKTRYIICIVATKGSVFHVTWLNSKGVCHIDCTRQRLIWSQFLLNMSVGLTSGIIIHPLSISSWESLREEPNYTPETKNHWWLISAKEWLTKLHNYQGISP